MNALKVKYMLKKKIKAHLNSDFHILTTFEDILDNITPPFCVLKVFLIYILC